METINSGTEIIENQIKGMIKHIGDNPEREGLIDTPMRVLKMWKEIYSGYGKNVDELFTVFSNEEHYDEMIILKDIDFFSTCEHHMLPFFGKVHIGYIPKEKIIGLSKLARIVEIYSRRLQIQERMTHEIADIINKKLQPIGVGVIVEGQHFCVASRGIKKINSMMVTSALFGQMKDDQNARQEFLKLIGV